MAEIVSAAQRMKDMVENILGKSRQRKDTEAVDFNLLLRRELDFMEADLVFKNEVEKEFSLAENLPPVECVYTDFSQTVGNLLRNTLDAMHNRQPKKLVVRTTFEEGLVVLEITDSGCGIPEENIPLLFDPFFTTKATEATGDEPVGTGLGLYMIQRLMEPYEVAIDVESEVDVGTTFRLKILPAG